MTLALTTAHAAALLAQATTPGSPQQPGGILGNPMVFMILMFVMMYFILIRPQRNKQKEQEDLQKNLQSGDEVVTIGGAHGVVTTVREKTVTVRVAEGKIEFDRSAIARKVPKVVEAEVIKK
ncbi:MAG: preprotein translocase subunit YajC [Verrucomicrobiaceae bacterium]